MAKATGKEEVRKAPKDKIYLVGRDEGPIKIGITGLLPSKRAGAARREMNDPAMKLIRYWVHEDAFMVEKFAHLYLQDFLLFGEWFSVTADVAINAVYATLEMMKLGDRRPLRKPNWFDEIGVSREDAAAYLATRPINTNAQSTRSSVWEDDPFRTLKNELIWRRQLATRP